MIIPEHKQNEKIEESSKLQEELAQEHREQSDSDPLPSYDDVSRSSQPSTVEQPESVVTTPTPIPKPTNFLYLSAKDKSIKGSYTIDPWMIIPTSLLPPQQTADTNNLDFTTKDGGINADIWLTDASAAGQTQRATLYLKSHDGSISARVRNVNNPVPFLLDVCARDGSVSIHLPRSFHGPVSLTVKDGSTKLSKSVLESATILAQIDSTRRYFIGDLSAMKDKDKWGGDELRIATKDGSVQVKYVDEPSKPGFFSRLLGY